MPPPDPYKDDSNRGSDILDRGLFVYIILNSLIWAVMRLTGGAVEPREYDLKEYWTWKPAGKKPAAFRLFSRRSYWGGKESLRGDDDESAFPGEENAESLRDLRSPSAAASIEKSARSAASVTAPMPAMIAARHASQ